MRGMADAVLGRGGWGTAVLLGCSLPVLASMPAQAQTGSILPTGEHVTAGDATIVRNGGGITVDQASAAAIIGWDAFSIGAGGAVRFENGGGATLNRVEGPVASRIDGSLSATGSVYLINPRGVVIGRSGVVDVGGSFIASSLDIDDAAFLAGGDRTFAGASRAAVVNLGRIGALGGDVALMATEVRNEGSIRAANGVGALLAGSRVVMRDAELDQGRFAVLLGGRSDSAANTGDIAAATAELRAAGGSVYALAGNITGITRASDISVVGGHILLISGEGGTVSIDRTRIAAPGEETTGLIEVSGTTVNVGSGAVLDVSGVLGGQIAVTADRLRFGGTALSRGIQGGDVTLTAPDIAFTGTTDTRGEFAGNLYIVQPRVTVDARMTSGIVRALPTTNITLLASPESFGGAVDDGDVIVAAPFTVSGGNRLSLIAADGIRFDANVTVGGAATIDLTAVGGDTGAAIVFAPNRSLSFADPGPAGRPGLTINGFDYGLIYTLADLHAINADPTLSYALARSISASGTVFSGAVVDVLGGDFDGLGHAITGLRIEAPDRYSVGLFGSMGGSIRNLDLVGGSVVGGSSVGALAAGFGEGTIARVRSSVAVTGRSTTPGGNVGGLIGSTRFGTIVDSGTTAAVYAPGASQVGGIAGSTYGSTIVRSFATGAVTGGSATGGIAGSVSRASVVDSYATGRVIGTDDVGGLVGVTSFGGGVANSQASGRVSGRTNVGGLVGRQLSAGVTDSLATGAVSASSGNGGGLVGYSDDGGVVGSRATGRVMGGERLGGLVGSMNASVVWDSSASGDVTATGSGIGGLVGYAITSGIARSVASGAVQGVSGVGGLVGAAPGLTVAVSSATGSVRGTSSVGGLIGSAGSRYGIYTDSFATGAVSGETDVGGLIGSTDNVQIAGSYATGTVTGTARSRNVGGLVGSLFASSVVDSRAEGRVLGAGNVGGLLGTSFFGTLRNVSAWGRVSGTLGTGENVGGLIGRSEIDDIVGARALNAVSGRVAVGGLIGRRTGGTLADVSATGPVSGTRNVGPLIGLDDPTP